MTYFKGIFRKLQRFFRCEIKITNNMLMRKRYSWYNR